MARDGSRGRTLRFQFILSLHHSKQHGLDTDKRKGSSTGLKYLCKQVNYLHRNMQNTAQIPGQDSTGATRPSPSVLKSVVDEMYPFLQTLEQI